MAKQAVKTKNVFVSYSHHDENYHDQLVKHLTTLQQTGIISTWTDRLIDPGDEWGVEIDEQLEAADIILLLISADFVASEYCREIELKRALEKHDDGSATVVPIIVRPVDVQGAPFAQLNFLPARGRPVNQWEDEDEAFKNIAEGIRRVAAARDTEDPNQTIAQWLEPPTRDVSVAQTPKKWTDKLPATKWARFASAAALVAFLAIAGYAIYKLVPPQNKDAYGLPPNATYADFVEQIALGKDSPNKRDKIANAIVDREYRWDLKILSVNEAENHYICGTDDTKNEPFFWVYVFPEKLHGGAEGRRLKNVEGKLRYGEIGGSTVYYIEEAKIEKEMLLESLEQFVTQIKNDPNAAKNYLNTCFEDWLAIFAYDARSSYRVNPLGDYSDVLIQLDFENGNPAVLQKEDEGKQVKFTGRITEILGTDRVHAKLETIVALQGE